MSSDAPKNKGLNQAAKETAKLSRDAYEWFKQEYVRTEPERAKAEQIANQVAEAGLAAQQKQNQIADEYNTYNKETFRPLEKRLVSEAQEYDTPERQQQAADRAVADVNMAAAAQRQATARDLASYGVAPDSATSMSIQGSGDINTTKAAAAAATGARDKVQATGYARMADAANLGRGLPSAQATAVSTGTQAGAGAVSASGASLNATQSGSALMSQGFNTAIQGQTAAGNLYGKQLGADVSSRGQTLGFLGNIIQSDPSVKKNRRTIKPEASMRSLRKTPIEQWQYDESKGGPPDDNEVRVGPMADRANETMGEEVAPGKQLLNVASMLGVVANSVKDLDKRMAKLEQRKVA